MEQRYLTLKQIDVYRVALGISEEIWKLVQRWSYFEKDTVGKQMVRAADSISANIAEGFGRYHKKDKIHFYRYAYGSIHESLDWLLKAKMRNLIQETEYQDILSKIQTLPVLLHQFIKYTDEKLKY
jgi:four helix bundle protein